MLPSFPTKRKFEMYYPWSFNIPVAVFASPENVDEDDLFVQHRRTVPVVRREVQNVARRNDVYLVADREFYFALHHQRHLFVRVTVDIGYDERVEREAADHNVLSHDHLAPDARCGLD